MTSLNDSDTNAAHHADNDCHHDWLVSGEPLNPCFTIDFWQGLTSGLVKCEACQQYNLLHLQAWQGRNLRDRIYSCAPLLNSSAAVFLRNMNSDYCDLTRKQQEVDALIVSAGPVQHLVLVKDTIVDSSCSPRHLKPGYLHWRELGDSDSWFSRFKELQSSG